MDRQPLLIGFYDELEKIAEAQAFEKLAATGLSLPELVKLSAADPEVYELMKQAGLFSRAGKFMKLKGAPAIAGGAKKVGRGVQRGHAAVQSNLGQAMAGAGRWGHHGSELVRGLPSAGIAGAMKGGSGTAAALHLAPEVAPIVTRQARRAAGAVGRAAGRVRRAAFPPHVLQQGMY